MARPTILGDVARGMIAGGAAVYALDRLDWYLWGLEGAAVRARTIGARPGGLDPAHVLANRLAASVGTTLSPAQPNPVGIAIHYGLGGLMGALYAVLRPRVGFVGAGSGVPFGMTMFLLQDEAMNTSMRTAGAPGNYPWQDHARGLAAHGFFGYVTDVLLRVLFGARRG